MPRAAVEGSDEGTQTHGAATYYDNAGSDSFLRVHHLEGILSPEEAGREDVRHEDQGLFADFWRRLHHGAIGKRHLHIVGLATILRGGPKEQGVDTAR